MTIDEIAKQVEAYANQYDCRLLTALNDYEFDGPSGSFGLTDNDYEAVAKKLGLWDEILRAKRDAYEVAMEY
jgi:hypothetical protein|tara:strand:+ start:2635 stop:2850 length:216 start_codon:yes stop_codon:yes gene_type:complete